MGGPVEKVDPNEGKGMTTSEILDKAKARAFRGGVTGAAAQAVNVLALMWLRTTMNYQMANGGGMVETIRLLYKEGGVPRFYRGLVPALIGSPISRFGDTFANAGALALTNSLESTKDLPVAVKTGFASVCAGGMRIALMPIDAWKTNKQVHGEKGMKELLKKVKNHGPTVFYHGGIAQATATAVGHYPWFLVYNYLDDVVPNPDGVIMKTTRNAGIGIAASVVSDVSSNGIRVLKTYRQTSKEPIGYMQAFNNIKNEYGLFGWNGLFLRGLQTRIVSHGINSAVFTVAWKIFQEM